MKLHRTQQRLLELLKQNELEPLTIREIQEALGVSSTSVVQHHIFQLEKKGYLRRNPVNSRDYQILAESPEKQVTYLNLYGLAQCGPNGSILDGDPIDRIPISTRILGFPSSEAFLVKAKGKSMLPKIHEGDLVIARKTSIADSGSIVVCVNNGEALVKKLQIMEFPNRPRAFNLISLNQDFQPFPASEDFRIEGIVRGVLSYAI